MKARDENSLHQEKPPRRFPWIVLFFAIPAFVSLVLAFYLFLSTALSRPTSAGADRLHDLEIALTQARKDELSSATSHSVITENSPRVAGAPSKGIFWIDAPAADVANFLMSSMSDDEILAQVFLVGWSSSTAEGPMMDWLKERGLGGAKIFGWNGGDIHVLASTIRTMQAVMLGNRLGIPLFTATDQEGGIVRHVKDTSSKTPGNMAIGAVGMGAEAYQSARIIASELRGLGINMNFAPDVDVYVNPLASVVSSRSFGSDPDLVALLGSAALRGMNDEGVIATAKHFPGHGNAVGDSHGFLPVLEDTFDTIWNRELVPYRRMIPEGLPAILMGHLAFPKISGTNAPASLSPELNEKILREKLGYSGLIITDDLYMGGATEYGASKGWGLPRLVVEALRAGNDLIMLSTTPGVHDDIWNTALATYKSDPTFRTRIRDSAHRILLVKLAYLKPSNRVTLEPDPKTVDAVVPYPGAKDFFDQEAARAVTLIRGSLPVVGDNARTLFIGQDPEFKTAVARDYPSSKFHNLGWEPSGSLSGDSGPYLASLASNADTVVINVINTRGLLALDALRGQASKLIVFSSLSPLALKSRPWAPTILAVFGGFQNSYDFGFLALRGLFKAPGVDPVHVDGKP